MTTIEAADYHDIVQVADPRVHPEGDRVAFVRKAPESDEDYESTIYVAPADGSRDPRAFTVKEGRDSQPRWSPDGEWLAFVSTRGADDDRPQLWVIPTDGGEGRQVTSVPNGVGNIDWSPDGTKIAFTQATTPEQREPGGAADANQGDGDADDPAAEFYVDPDYEPETPDPRVVDRTVWRSMQRYFDRKRSHVYVLDLAALVEGAGDGDQGEAGDLAGGLPADVSGEPDLAAGALTRLTEGEYDHHSPTWADASTLYYGVFREEPDPDDSMVFDVLAHDVAADEAEQVFETTGWQPALAAVDAEAGHRVAYTRTPPERSSLEQTELEVWDRESDLYWELTADLDRTLGYQAAPVWGPDKETVYFATPDEGSVACWRAPADGSADPEAVLRAGDGLRGSLAAAAEEAEEGEEDAEAVDSLQGGGELLGIHLDGDTLAYGMAEWHHRGDVFASGPDGEDPRRLSHVNADYLDEREVQEPEELWFDAPDGHECQGWVLTPPDFDPAETYPMVVEIHGGPHAMYSTTGTMFHEFQTLAHAGYVVFWSNPRGSVGYGQDVHAAIERDWGAVTMGDVMAGAELVAGREYVDDEECFVTGGSFGGYMTAWTVGHTDRFTAAVTQRGVYDLASWYGSTDGAYKLTEGDFGATPWEEPGMHWEHSPVAYADQVETPTLIVHADDDFRVPINNGEMLYRAYKRCGVETRLVQYPREGHELSRSGEPAHVVDRVERIVRWFDGYSEYRDVPPAIERDPDEGLSAAAENGDGGDAGDADEESDG